MVYASRGTTGSRTSETAPPKATDAPGNERRTIGRGTPTSDDALTSAPRGPEPASRPRSDELPPSSGDSGKGSQLRRTSSSRLRGRSLPFGRRGGLGAARSYPLGPTGGHHGKVGGGGGGEKGPPRRTPIYLDHNASTPLHPRVRDAVIRALDEGFANPSAGHVFGRRAREIVDEARVQMAALLGCDADEIVLTGGGTEANNLALRGLPGRSLVVSSVEHPATTEPARILGAAGARIVEVPVGGDGAVDPAAVAHALEGASGPALVSVILAQNETGVIQPLGAVAERARAHGALVHADAAQAVGKIAVDVRALGVDLLSVAGHKLYAPKGVGALYVRRGLALAPLLVGAGHERGLRPGTENVSGIAGLGAACALARGDLATEAPRQRALRDRLEARLAPGGFVVHGAGAERLPNTVNGRFPRRPRLGAPRPRPRGRLLHRQRLPRRRGARLARPPRHGHPRRRGARRRCACRWVGPPPRPRSTRAAALLIAAARG